jgi:hypothetical protein
MMCARLRDPISRQKHLFPLGTFMSGIVVRRRFPAGLTVGKREAASGAVGKRLFQVRQILPFV